VNKAEKRLARLWEDTVVVALRDMQWQSATRAAMLLIKAVSGGEGVDSPAPARLIADLRRQLHREETGIFSSSVVPPGFVKLDGNAEGRTADLALADCKGHCFLVEVKSERGRIVDEWRSRAKKKSQDSKSKSAFRRLKQLVDTHNLGSSQIDLIRKSLLGHQVAYWANNGERGESGAIKGKVFLEPYILACAGASALSDRAAKRSMDKPSGIVAKFVTNGEPRKSPWRIPATELLGGHSKMQIAHQNDPPEQFSGLGVESFIGYIKWLCEDAQGGAEPVNCIVLTTDGFFQIVSDTSQLAALVAAPSATLHDEPGVMPRRR